MKANATNYPVVLGGDAIVSQRIPFVRPALPDFAAIEPELRQMLASGMLTKGQCLEQFEHAVAEHLQVRHAVAVSSCTAGLMLAYRALGLEGEVIAPSFTFMATVSALVWAGARPVFADVDAGSATLDPAAVERAITPRTTAIVGVHTFGNPADMEALESLARRRGLALVLDAAHGFGSLYRGKPVGAAGDAHVFSLSPTKLLVAGEGGIVATNNDAVARYVRLAREYGNDGGYDSVLVGINARMPEMCALVGLHGLPLLEGVAERRNAVAARYRGALEQLPGVELQTIRPGDRSSYKDFSIVIDEVAFGVDRDLLATALAAEGIDTRKYYSPTVHQQTAYRRFASGAADLAASIRLGAGSLSLPMGTYLCDETISRICEAVKRIHQHADRVRAWAANGAKAAERKSGAVGVAP